ncbi:MAG: sigma-70 family RNA polymerase sigma factor [Candidatus Zixiibacteriota bacterium]
MEAEKMDAELLVKKTLAGNKKAFESIIERHQRLVSHIVFRMIQNASDQEDICQDVFLKVYQNLRGFQFEAKLSTWIAKIAYNTCLNYLEKKRVPLFDDLTPEEKTIETVSDSSYRPDQVVEGKETSSVLRSEVEKMPVHYRTVLTLYHLDQMSYKEIGEMTELPEGTVKSYLFRARRLLKDRLLAKYQREDLCH